MYLPSFIYLICCIKPNCILWVFNLQNGTCVHFTWLINKQSNIFIEGWENWTFKVFIFNMVWWGGAYQLKKNTPIILNKNFNTRQSQRHHKSTFSAESELSEDGVVPAIFSSWVCGGSSKYIFLHKGEVGNPILNTYRKPASARLFLRI